MNLYNSSCPADEMCMLPSREDANMYLGAKNASLARLVTSSKHEHIAWYDPDARKNSHGNLLFTRAFVELPSYFKGEVYEIVAIHPIAADKDVFFVNGNLYFLHCEHDNAVIRKITAYVNQDLIEKFESFTGGDINAKSFYLANLYLIENNAPKYAFTCWGVADDESCSYLPVFEKDYHYLVEYDINAFATKEVSIGEIFKAHGYYYKVLINEEGKICLDQSTSIFTLYHGNKLGNKEKKAMNAKVISLNCQVKEIGG